MSDSFTHPTNLSLPPLVQRHYQSCLLVQPGFHADLCGQGHPILESNPGGQPRQGLLIRVAPNLDPIDLRHAVFGVGQHLSQFPIIGKKHDSAGVIIQTPDREQMFPTFAHHLADRLSALRVRHARDHPYRFVIKEIAQSVEDSRSAVHGQLVRNGVRAGPQMLNNLAVQPNTAFTNQILCRPSRSYSRSAENLLNPLHPFHQLARSPRSGRLSNPQRQPRPLRPLPSP